MGQEAKHGGAQHRPDAGRDRNQGAGTCDVWAPRPRPFPDAPRRANGSSALKSPLTDEILSSSAIHYLKERHACPIQEG